MGVSLRPSTFSAGGSLVDDADLTVSKARFIMTDYGGKSDAEVCVLQLMLREDDDTEHEQMYSLGTGFVPSETGKEEENGKELTPVGDKTSPNGSSNFALLINSMVNAGVPEDLFDGDISAIEGLKGHYNRVPAPKRGNLPKRPGQAEKKYEATVLLFTTVVTLPGEAKAAKTAVKGAPVKTASKVTPIAAAKPAAGGELNDVIAEHLIGIFAGEGLEEMKKVQIVTKLFKAIPNDDPQKKAIIAEAGKSEVLAALDGFTFDGTILKIA